VARPWLRFVGNNITAALALGLAPGVASIMAMSKIGAPLWPVAIAPPFCAIMLIVLAPRFGWIRAAS
jgi:hypothetical protein